MVVKKKKLVIFSVVTVFLLTLVLWIVWGNRALQLNTYSVSSETLPKAFDGYRIAHVSDLHNAEMGENNEQLLALLKEAKPDMIAMTGDLIDSRHTNVDIALQLAEKAMQIAPCYYVTGNHEARVSEYDDLKNGLTELGVTVLEDARLSLEHNSEILTIVGINDPSFKTDYLFGNDASVTETQLQKLINENDGFTVLLSHRPEQFEVYADNNVDLALSGHAHGGQFRLPFIGGLVAPNQGLFPEYDAGLYTYGSTTMIVSRGIGNSIFPFRFNNRPEVVLIELQRTVS